GRGEPGVAETGEGPAGRSRGRYGSQRHERRDGGKLRHRHATGEPWHARVGREQRLALALGRHLMLLGDEQGEGHLRQRAVGDYEEARRAEPRLLDGAKERGG